MSPFEKMMDQIYNQPQMKSHAMEGKMTTQETLILNSFISPHKVEYVAELNITFVDLVPIDPPKGWDKIEPGFEDPRAFDHVSDVG
jgi:hypothetical protein